MLLPKVKNHILIRKGNSESFAVNLKSGEIYTLNETALRILVLCKEEANFNDALDRITKEFEGDPAEVKKDILSTIKAFKKYGFLEEKH